MSIALTFDNSYARLPGSLFTRMAPTPVARPQLIAWNRDLAERLGLATGDATPQARADIFAGNAVPEGAAPMAQAYGGHQFGQWNPGLGDGRALLLGEVVAPDGARFDVQLKGSGRTPYSRSGDGRAWIGPVLREYVVSEGMAALGVPTTRALAAVTTGEPVLRERPLPGAILTRVAASHIRVGTFQLAAARGDLDSLRALAEHAIARHYPEADGVPGLLSAVTRRQAELVAQWMAVGFVHGVMNTDNCAISGETIDYGPCAFMDVYHPETVFSSIDHMGRYAYRNQPQIALWNVAQFATALVPLMPDQDAAVAQFTEIINGFADIYQAAYLARFSAKLGVADAPEPLISRWLSMLTEARADFTQAFAALGEGRAGAHLGADPGFAEWERDWRALDPDTAAMARVNPRVIPRTHRIEEAIAAAIEEDYALFEALLEAATHPFEPSPEFERAPQEEERVRQTFCGT